MASTVENVDTKQPKKLRRTRTKKALFDTDNTAEYVFRFRFHFIFLCLIAPSLSTVDDNSKDPALEGDISPSVGGKHTRFISAYRSDTYPIL